MKRHAFVSGLRALLAARIARVSAQLSGLREADAGHHAGASVLAVSTSVGSVEQGGQT